MDKTQILNELKSYKNFPSDTMFAKFIGITSQSLSNWYKRGTCDIDRIAEIFPEVSAEWLLRGKEPMLNTYNSLFDTEGFDGAIVRIMQVLQRRGISIAVFESQLGMREGTLKKMEENKANVNEDLIRKVLAVCPEVSAFWLLTGEGNISKEETPSKVTVGSNNVNTQVGNGNTISNNQEELSALKEENAILRAKYSELEKRYDDLIGRLAGK